MFERNVAFDTKPNFRGNVLASYPKDRNPLRSGYLLGPEHLQGKAAAIDADYGNGHVILIGFRTAVARRNRTAPINSCSTPLYYNPSMAPEARCNRPAGAAAGEAEQILAEAAWKTQAEALKTELTALLDQNRAYFTARGPRAEDEGKKLESMLDAFQRDRIPLLDDLRAQVEDQPPRRAAKPHTPRSSRNLPPIFAPRISARRKLEDLLDQYKLAVIP